MEDAEMEIFEGDEVVIQRINQHGFVHRKKFQGGTMLYGIRFRPMTNESAVKRGRNTEYCDAYCTRDQLSSLFI